MNFDSIYKKVGFMFAAVLFVLLPFHAFMITFLSSVFAGTTADSITYASLIIASWKELLMIAMALMILVRCIMKKKFPFHFLLIDYLILLLFIWSLFSAYFQSDSLLQGIVGIRFDFEFFFLYWIIRSLDITKAELNKLLKILLVTSGVIIVLGFIQIFLSCETMSTLGYTTYISSWVASKPLPCAHGIGAQLETIRMMSTFSGPNQLASFLLIIIISAWTLLTNAVKGKKENSQYLYIFLIVIAITALYLTYSRGAILALLVSFMSILVLQATNAKRSFGYLIVGIVVSILLFAGSTLLSPDRMDSTKEHFEKPIEGVQLIIEQPWGYGIGMAGPASMRFPADGSKAIISENWYLQIAQEFGLLGGILFFLLLSYIMRFLYQRINKEKDPHMKNILITILAIYVGLLVNNLFLHTWSSDMITSLIFWSIFGLAVNITTPKKKNLLQ